MDAIYGWIRNLTGFFLFMSVIENLLPNKKYGKYVRLFSGMVLILLVLQPLTGSLRLEDKIAHYYESFVFRYQADDLQSEILGIEKQRLSQMIAQYEHAVAQDVAQMAEDMGFAVRECSVAINSEEGTEQFGTVTGISLRISAGNPGVGGSENGAAAGSAANSENPENEPRPIAPVEPVIIGEAVRMGEQESAGEEAVEIGEQAVAGGAVDAGEQAVARGAVDAGEPAVAEAVAGEAAVTEGGTIRGEPEVIDAYSRSRGQLDAEIGKLRRKIASYYSLEEAYVEIQIVEG